MFMFVPKFNFLIICENMKKSLNNKNHFPSFHFCLIVIISLGATLWQFCCCPLGMAACRCLFSLGKTIIIVPEKEKVFLDMLCRGRSTGKKKNLQLLGWNWALSEELSLLPELMERYFLNTWLIHVYEILSPRHYRKWFSTQSAKRKSSSLYAGHLTSIFKVFHVSFHPGFLVFQNSGNWVLWLSQVRI